MAKGKTTKIGRSAVTGQFTTVAKAERASRTHVVERITKATTCKSNGNKS